MNEQQERIARHVEHPLLVDAGPGTGKTYTVVERFMHLIESGVDPRKVMLVTFTNNAADEMRKRIRTEMTGRINEYAGSVEKTRMVENLKRAVNEVRASTFDSMCLRVVLDAPEHVSTFFGFKDVTLSRNARLVTSDALNAEHFRRSYASFIARKGHLYVRRDRDGNIIEDIPSIFADNVDHLLRVINKLMATGIIPLADEEWFSEGYQRLRGRTTEMYELLTRANEDARIGNKIFKERGKCCPELDPIFGGELGLLEKISVKDRLVSPEVIDAIVDGNRSLLIHFFNAVYYDYIHRCVSDNRLTFSLVSLFAFCVLYSDERSREVNSVEHMIVDEFQDTNAMQMKICLLLLERDNICVVGDWKQGIYQFRFASIDNIANFQSRISSAVRELNSDGTRRVRIGSDVQVTQISLEKNYRSHRNVLDWAFKVFDIGAYIHDENLSITKLDSVMTDEYGPHSRFEFFPAENRDNEFDAVVNKITEYVHSGDYVIHDDDVQRPPRYGDIAVLYRKVGPCVELYDRLRAAGIPAFLQGDINIMATVPGKLALAWLRFINDKGDRNGIATILVHEGYSLSQISGMFDEVKDGKNVLEAIPKYIAKQRAFLYAKRKRPNDLLTSIFAFHRIGDDDDYTDIVQAIIVELSSSSDTSLMTIPDMIRLIEDDIKGNTRYDIDAAIMKDAVSIQTMHKSKGLEYPIVIIGSISDMGVGYDRSPISFDPIFGLRCSKTFVRSRDGECLGHITSWMHYAISESRPVDHNEDCRLIFVAMTRAKQYMFMTGDLSKKSNGPKFFDHFRSLADDCLVGMPRRFAVDEGVIQPPIESPPEIPEFKARRRSVDVHGLMRYNSADSPNTSRDGGKDYGNALHFIADRLASHPREDRDAAVLAEIIAQDNGVGIADLTEDTLRINRFLASLDGAALLTEVDCWLLVNDTMIRGTIDLIVDRGDSIEIYDYKTESDLRNLDEYRLQVSIYAYSVMGARRTESVKAYLYYVSSGDDPMAIDLVPMSTIEKALEDYKSRTSSVPDADYR